MKKFLCIFFLILLCLMPNSSFATEEREDLSALSLEELLLRFYQYDTEIHNRITPDGEFIIYPGTYTCGVDLPAGSYEIRGYTTRYMVNIYVYENNEQRQAYNDYSNPSLSIKLYGTFYSDEKNSPLYVSLLNENIMVLKDGAIYTIKQAKTFHFE